jgi:uncharacterized protein (TIGR03435 family)
LPRAINAEAAVSDGSFTIQETRAIVRAGGAIEPGAVVSSNEQATLQMSDSRVETKEQSEFLWERAEDGIRIRLNKGSVIVNARPGTGRIYVQTPHAIVFGASSIFMVVAEEDGSHVGVIQGEARVQQGAAEKELQAAEQLTTNPSMEMLRMAEALAWSRNAAAHLAMLTQARGKVIEKPIERTRFEVVSIRPSSPLRIGGSRGTPSREAGKPIPDIQENIARTAACGGLTFELELDPHRFSVKSATIYRLITLGYGLKNCALMLQTGAITNGPNWIQSERYDIEALIPDGSPAYTSQELNRGEASALQLMIQNLLADRFKLTLHRESKDVVAFNLVVVKPGMIKQSEDQTTPEPVPRGRGFISSALPRGVMLNCAGNAVAISAVANCLQRSAGGTIVDMTNLAGLYDIPQVFNWDFTIPGSQGAYASQLLEQIGLKLEPVKSSAEVFIIDRVTKPAEN